MKNQINKKIGVIGGVGPQATQFIYGKIIEFSQKKYGAQNNDDYPRILIESVPVPDFISDTSQIETAKEMLVEAIHSLTKAGATKLCIGSNTVHILLDELKKATSVGFISMVELVAKKCVKHNFKKVGFLGTLVLLKSGLYARELQKHGIEIILPTDEQIIVLDKIIRCVLAGQKIDY